MSAGVEPSSIDELLDRAVGAIKRGDHTTASSLAQQVLAADRGNVDAEDLLATSDEPGEIHRLTILFADLVGSTKLSTRVEPETYRLLVPSTTMACAARSRATLTNAVSRMPADSALPELARARAALE